MENSHAEKRVQRIDSFIASRTKPSLEMFMGAELASKVKNIILEYSSPNNFGLHFNQDQAIWLYNDINQTLSGNDIPKYMKDILFHDASNDGMKYGHLFTTPHTLDADIMKTTTIEALNYDFKRLSDFVSEVKNHTKVSPLDADMVVEQAITRFFMTPYSKGKTVKVSVDSGTEILASKALAENLLYNVWKNSALYAPESNTLEVRVRRGTGDTNHIILSDDGLNPLQPDFVPVSGEGGGKGSGKFLAAVMKYASDLRGAVNFQYTDARKQRGTTTVLSFQKAPVQSENMQRYSYTYAA